MSESVLSNDIEEVVARLDDDTKSELLSDLVSVLCKRSGLIRKAVTCSGESVIVSGSLRKEMTSYARALLE
jgi:hypothetical protein